MVYQNKGLDETLVKFVLRNYIYMNRTREKEKGDTFCTGLERQWWTQGPDCHEREASGQVPSSSNMPRIFFACWEFELIADRGSQLPVNTWCVIGELYHVKIKQL